MFGKKLLLRNMNQIIKHIFENSTSLAENLLKTRFKEDLTGHLAMLLNHN